MHGGGDKGDAHARVAMRNIVRFEKMSCRRSGKCKISYKLHVRYIKDIHK
jgi:hypothetical protein